MIVCGDVLCWLVADASQESRTSIAAESIVTVIIVPVLLRNKKSKDRNNVVVYNIMIALLLAGFRN